MINLSCILLINFCSIFQVSVWLAGFHIGKHEDHQALEINATFRCWSTWNTVFNEWVFPVLS